MPTRSSAEDHEFKVSLKGLKLSAEHEARISSAIQRAVMIELAGMDFKGSMNLDFLGTSPGGIAVVAVRGEDQG